MVKSDKGRAQDSPSNREERASSSPPGVLARLGMGNTSFTSEAAEDQLKAGLADPVWSVRVAAIETLAQRGERIPTELLVNALGDKNGFVRAAAVRAVGALKEQALVDQVVRALQDPEWSVRAAAALALGSVEERVSVESLVRTLQDDEDESVRVAAASALGKLKERAPIEALVSALGDSEWRVREMAALVLGEMGERAPVEPLVSVLRDEVDRPVREAVRLALKQTHPDVFSTLSPERTNVSSGRRRRSRRGGNGS